MNKYENLEQKLAKREARDYAAGFCKGVLL